MTGPRQSGALILIVACALAAPMTVAAADSLSILRQLSSMVQPTQAVGSVSPENTETVRSRLAERGMQDIRNLRREGDIYRADALWYGETVDVQVDAATGEIKQPARLSSKQIDVILRDLGWRHVDQAERAGDVFRIRVQQDRRMFELKIDARTGKIIDVREDSSPQSESLGSGDIPQR